MKIHNILRC